MCVSYAWRSINCCEKSLSVWSHSSSTQVMRYMKFTGVLAAKWPGSDCRAFTAVVLDSGIYRNAMIHFVEVKRWSAGEAYLSFSSYLLPQKRVVFIVASTQKANLFISSISLVGYQITDMTTEGFDIPSASSLYPGRYLTHMRPSLKALKCEFWGEFCIYIYGNYTLPPFVIVCRTSLYKILSTSRKALAACLYNWWIWGLSLQRNESCF